MKKTILVLILALLALILLVSCQHECPPKQETPLPTDYSKLVCSFLGQRADLSQEDSNTISEILGGSSWKPAAICDCLPIYKLENDTVSIRVHAGFTPHIYDVKNNLKASLTEEERKTIQRIMINAYPDISNVKVYSGSNQSTPYILADDRLAAICEVLNSGTWEVTEDSNTNNYDYLFTADYFGEFKYSSQSGVLSNWLTGCSLILSEEQRNAINDLMFYESLRLIDCADGTTLPISMASAQMIHEILEDEALSWDRVGYANPSGYYMIETKNTTYYFFDWYIEGFFIFEMQDATNNRATFLTKEQTKILNQILGEADSLLGGE